MLWVGHNKVKRHSFKELDGLCDWRQHIRIQLYRAVAEDFYPHANSFPATQIRIAVPHPLISNHMAGGCNTAVIYHGAPQQLESQLYIGFISNI